MRSPSFEEVSDDLITVHISEVKEREPTIVLNPLECASARSCLVSSFTTDALVLDELSRSWLSGRDQLSAHFDRILNVASDVKSDLQEVREVTWGDTRIVAGRLEQSYTIDGKPMHVSAPTTAVLRNEEGQWRIALLHSAPLPEA